MMAVVYQVMTNAGVSVGSEEVEPWDGWPYDTILADLTVTPTMNEYALATVIVDRYMDSYGYTGSETQSAMDNSALPNLGTAVDNLAQALINEINGGNWAQVQQARSETEEIYYNYYIDLYHFAKMVDTYVPGATTQAQAVMNEVSWSMYEAHGTSDTQWNEFLVKYLYPSGAGLDDIAVFRNGKWFVDMTGDHVADRSFWYGIAGDIPLVGDINQDGKDDTIIFRNGRWFVDMTGDHVADESFWYGIAGDVPLVGDINQDGTDDTIIFRNGKWFVDMTGDHVADESFWYGIAGDVPLVGDINQDGKDDTIIFRNGKWYVDTDYNHVADERFWYGTAGDVPLVGDMNQDGTDDTIIFRNGKWFVDTDYNHVADEGFWYGTAGDKPVVGDIG
jgi:predicted acetyltransferase